MMVVERAKQAGVTQLVTVGTTITGSKRGVQIAEQYKEVWATIGVHPSEAEELTGSAREHLRALTANPKVVAIGETGIDLYHQSNPPLAAQQAAFEQQAELAVEFGLPLVVHTRQAPAETVAILQTLPAVQTGVVHCFEGDRDFADHILDRGFLISFTANVTYPKNDRLREVVKHVPLARMMLETDAPFLPPHGKRGERNESATVRAVAELVAELKEISLDQVAAETTANATRLFGLHG